jgi:NADPH-dependent 7-cyano-7-deazaguanine reductase QueF
MFMTDSLAYDYLRLVLEQEFLKTYLRFMNHGILHYELTNIMEICAPLLEGLDDDDRYLRYEITGTIAKYLLEE